MKHDWIIKPGIPWFTVRTWIEMLIQSWWFVDKKRNESKSFQVIETREIRIRPFRRWHRIESLDGDDETRYRIIKEKKPSKSGRIQWKPLPVLPHALEPLESAFRCTMTSFISLLLASTFGFSACFFGYFPRTIGVNRNERLDVKYDHFFLLNFHIEKKNEMTTFSFPFTVLQF